MVEGSQTARQEERPVLSTPRPINSNSPLVSGVTRAVLNMIVESQVLTDYINQFCDPTTKSNEDNHNVQRLRRLMEIDRSESFFQVKLSKNGYKNIQVGEFYPEPTEYSRCLDIGILPENEIITIGVVTFKKGTVSEIMPLATSFGIAILPAGSQNHGVYIRKLNRGAPNRQERPEKLEDVDVDANTYNAMLAELLGIVESAFPKKNLEAQQVPVQKDHSSEEPGFGWFGKGEDLDYLNWHDLMNFPDPDDPENVRRQSRRRGRRR